MKHLLHSTLLPLLLCTITTLSLSADSAAHQELTNMYQSHCNQPCDINEHIPVLKKLASECSSVAEIGIRTVVSTWGVLLGLAESSSQSKSYLGIDLDCPPLEKLYLAKHLAKENGINFQFWQINDMAINIDDINPVDMLFIDSLHTYCHLTYELEKFSPKVRKYITLHDTSYPWGNIDDRTYSGDYSEYPQNIDRTKKGLWPAVEDFLKRHSEWILVERRLNNHGFTILARIRG